MIIHKSICGLCKPNKKFKKNNTRLRSIINNALESCELSRALMKSYTKINKL